MKMLKALPLLFLMSGLTLSCEISFAQTYKWVDAKGVMHFSDRPQTALSSLPPAIPAQSPPDSVPLLLPKKSIEKEVLLPAEPVKMDSASERVKKSAKLYDFRGKVTETIGVDMIVLDSGKRVKYIGVKDPSPFLSKNGMESRIEEAHGHHRKLVMGKTVTVLLGETNRDPDGSYLGHVFLGQQAFINAELIRSGYALTEDYPSDFEYQSLFIRLQRYAQENGLGIWKF